MHKIYINTYADREIDAKEGPIYEIPLSTARDDIKPRCGICFVATRHRRSSGDIYKHS